MNQAREAIPKIVDMIERQPLPDFAALIQV